MGYHNYYVRNECVSGFLQNIRVMAKYYTRITMKRMAELLDLTIDVSVIYISYLYEAYLYSFLFI